jgi:hypothetical protein
MTKSAKRFLKSYVREARHKLFKEDYGALREATGAQEFFLSHKPISNDEIKRLYKKVCEMCASDEYIANPISRLIDEKYLSTLSPVSREQYVMSMSKLYVAMRDQCESEREIAFDDDLVFA